MLKLSFLFLILASNSLSVKSVFAEETFVENVKESGSDAQRSMKKNYRNVKDKTCELVNGKMECTLKKIKHNMENINDKMEDATENHSAKPVK